MKDDNIKGTEDQTSSLCYDCESLVGKHRHIPPHKNLVRTKSKEMKSIHGYVDENFYKCKICSKIWLHETGSSGEGWI